MIEIPNSLNYSRIVFKTNPGFTGLHSHSISSMSEYTNESIYNQPVCENDTRIFKILFCEPHCNKEPKIVWNATKDIVRLKRIKKNRIKQKWMLHFWEINFSWNIFTDLCFTFYFSAFNSESFILFPATHFQPLANNRIRSHLTIM